MVIRSRSLRAQITYALFTEYRHFFLWAVGVATHFATGLSLAHLRRKRFVLYVLLDFDG